MINMEDGFLVGKAHFVKGKKSKEMKIFISRMISLKICQYKKLLLNRRPYPPAKEQTGKYRVPWF